MKKCPWCAEEIRDEAVVCRFCGHDLTLQAKTAPPRASRTCPRCHAPVLSGQRYCPKCGQDVLKRPRRLGRWIIGSATTVVICGGIVTWLLLRPDPLVEASTSVALLQVLDEDGKPVSQGSGFLIDDAGGVATNFHVVEGGSRVRVELPNGQTTETSTLLGADEYLDLAILKTDLRGLRPLNLAAGQPTIGDEVTVLGSPLGLTNTLSKGVVSGKRSFGGTDFYQITAPISPGSSGGPVLDRHGRVLGLATAFLPMGQNINFSVPAFYLKHLVGTHTLDLRSLGRVGAGIELSQLAEHFKSEGSEFRAYPRYPVPEPRTPTSMQDTSMLLRVGEELVADSRYSSILFDSTVLASSASAVRSGSQDAGWLATELGGYFCMTGPMQRGIARYPSYFPTQLSEWCDTVGSWRNARHLWFDSVAQGIYGQFKSTLGGANRGGGWDGVYVGQGPTGNWFLWFMLQSTSGTAFGSYCWLGSASPGTWSSQQICQFPTAFKALLYEGGRIVTNIGFGSYDSITVNPTKPVQWGQLSGGDLGLTWRMPFSDSLADLRAVAVPSPPAWSVTGVWDVLYPDESGRQSRIALFQNGSQVAGIWMEQSYSSYEGRVIWTEMSTVAGNVDKTTLTFKPSSYVMTCQGEVQSSGITGTCTSELRSGKVSRLRFEATRRGE